MIPYGDEQSGEESGVWMNSTIPRGKLSVIVGGLFGSESKGQVAGWLASSSIKNVACVRVAGPNAGHSATGVLDGRTWALRQVPIAAVTRLDAALYISAGSEVDFEVLDQELRDLDAAGYKASTRLFVDSAATVLTQEDRDTEAESDINKRLGSTAKGIGAARIRRLARKAPTVGGVSAPFIEMFPGVSIQDNTGEWLTLMMRDHDTHVIIEGAQGYGLGLHTKYYPFVTSSDCRAIDFLAMCGITPWTDGLPTPEVWVVIRPYPIRVAGNSGPLLGETTWEALGLPEEKTTVTKRVRRVGIWDADLIRAAVAANGGNVRLAFGMMDQVVPEITGFHGPIIDSLVMTTGAAECVQEWINRAVSAAGDGSTVAYIGTGPGTCLWHEPVAPVVPTAESELYSWWMGMAREEVDRTIPKALAYGRGPSDLVAIGRMVEKLAGRPADWSDVEAAEAGILFYLCGKIERVLSSMTAGRVASDDCWFDIGVYSRMVQRLRATGTWP